MKIKYGTRHNWRRVLKKSYSLIQHSEEILIATVSIEKVTTPLIVEYDNHFINVADTGYQWAQYFIKQQPFVITTVINPQQKITQWYIDVCQPFEIDDDGNPYFVDLFLDVVVFPDGSFYLLDEDELEEALEKKQIPLKDYHLAKQTATKLLADFQNGDFSLLDITKTGAYTCE